ncbi:MAG: calcium:cation antiporter [Mycobacteriales bacterium]
MNAGPLRRGERVLLAAAAILTAASAALHYHPVGAVTPFVVSAVALAALAALVGRSVHGLGSRLGSGATGVLQSALGNLPELFVGIFALRAGLLTVVRAALIGSILANVLLVLGLAFVVGGVRHGVQSFDAPRARIIAAQLLLAVAALAIPTLAKSLDTPAARHESALSGIAAVVLLIVFCLSIPASLRRASTEPEPGEEPRWPLALALGLLAATSVGAAFVSDWFIAALGPAVRATHLSQAFTGLVIVAIAGNAVENVVGIQLAARNQSDYALSVILNSPLQIALVLAPGLVLLSHVVGGPVLTLALPPLLLAVLVLAVAVAAFVVVDGESTWLEGAALLGLYVVTAAAFYWG